MVFQKMCIFIVVIFVCCVSCNNKTNENDVEVILSVQNHNDVDFFYNSYDEGITWENDNVPPFYMTVESIESRSERGDVLLTIFITNNSGYELTTGARYTLQRYEGGEWINVSLGNIVTPDIGYSIYADERVELTQLVPKKLEKGRYRILKDIIDSKSSEKWTCVAQFEM